MCLSLFSHPPPSSSSSSSSTPPTESTHHGMASLKQTTIRPAIPQNFSKKSNTTTTTTATTATTSATSTTATPTAPSSGTPFINNFLDTNPLKEKEKFTGKVTDQGFQPDAATIERIKRNPELKKKLPNMTPTGDGGFTCDAGYFENVTITHAPTLTEQSRLSKIGMATTGKVVQKNDYEYAQHANAAHYNQMAYRRVIVHESGVLFVHHLLKNHLPGSYPHPVICGSRRDNPYVRLMTKMFPDGGGGSGGKHDMVWVTKMNNRALQKVSNCVTIIVVNIVIVIVIT